MSIDTGTKSHRPIAKVASVAERTGVKPKQKHYAGKTPKDDPPKRPKQKFSDAEIGELLRAERIVFDSFAGNILLVVRESHASGQPQWRQSIRTHDGAWTEIDLLGRRSLTNELQEARAVYVGFGSVEPDPKPIESNQTKRVHAKRDEQGASE